MCNLGCKITKFPRYNKQKSVFFHFFVIFLVFSQFLQCGHTPLMTYSASSMSKPSGN